ncbi:hypothetical protein [Spirochaeta cellobiosiphila]|uniref:hypothetical protein n=1 Tax=Spirochaeta cellobiosiphila TaxID=504483 RepID=UPI0004248ADE|nr:hypothetical protein [Spirochaeta cellobiosiphila]
MAKICRLFFLIIILIMIISCKSSEKEIVGKFDFKDTSLSRFNYEFSYILYDSDMNILIQEPVDIYLLSYFKISIIDKTKFLQIYTRRVTIPNENENITTDLIEDKIHSIEDIIGTELVLHVISSIIPEQGINEVKEYNNVENIEIKWSKKKNIDYYFLGLYKRDGDKDKEYYLFLIPREINHLNYKLMQSAKELDSYSDIERESSVYLYKKTFNGIPDGEYYYWLTGVLINNGERRQVAFPIENKRKLIIHNK